MSTGWRARLGWTGWRRELGWSLVALGLLTSCLLAAAGSGHFIPSQDPTPEMLAQEARDGRVTVVLLAIGCTAGPLIMGAGIWLIRWGRRTVRRTVRLLEPGRLDEGPAGG
jgi:hypothetical protein